MSFPLFFNAQFAQGQSLYTVTVIQPVFKHFFHLPPRFSVGGAGDGQGVQGAGHLTVAAEVALTQTLPHQPRRKGKCGVSPGKAAKTSQLRVKGKGHMGVAVPGEQADGPGEQGAGACEQDVDPAAVVFRHGFHLLL